MQCPCSCRTVSQIPHGNRTALVLPLGGGAMTARGPRDRPKSLRSSYDYLKSCVFARSVRGLRTMPAWHSYAMPMGYELTMFANVNKIIESTALVNPYAYRRPPPASARAIMVYGQDRAP